MSTRGTSARLLGQQRTAREHIEKVRIARGGYAADCYVGGLLLGMAEYMIDHYGRRAAYDYFAGFADDLILPESSDEQLGR